MASRPARAARQSTSSATHSGKLLLRMPPALHARLAQEAEREGVSLNQLITKRLEQSAPDARNGRAGRPEAAPEPASPAPARFTSLALGVNLVVVVLAGAVAIALLVLALADLS